MGIGLGVWGKRESQLIADMHPVVEVTIKYLFHMGRARVEFTRNQKSDRTIYQKVRGKKNKCGMLVYRDV